MLNKSKVSSKLSELLFLELKEEVLLKIFGYTSDNELYFPIKSKNIINDLQSGDQLENIPVKYFIEGMSFILGCDNQFRYAKEYLRILKKNSWSMQLINSFIAESIKNSQQIDAYVFLRAEYTVDESSVNYEKLISFIYESKEVYNAYKDDFLDIVSEGKNKKYAMAFLYESLYFNDTGDYSSAWDSLNLYYSYDGKNNESILRYKDDLMIMADFEKGKDNVNADPKLAFKLLVPLIDKLPDNAFLYFYIAVACRNLGLYEKAIYYLNEAKSIDDTIIDIYNEIGLNYAQIGNFQEAIKYFRKIFEATKAIDVCTNLIMCYINIGDKKNALLHLEIAKKMNKDDDIVKQLEKLI
ncbi:tetratricopeptide repeat protein [Clostridium oryzae]|uniref:Tetratricopeptide repeat protein n=1 Tax=Clostridium oryzae TaxID=1450648 RepID=A0A1V4IC44_9CLOT|nr:tetratricopeptide repeat protein [Clostridium oryzae]OPJ57503.1 tetratricopeptide repeat protein [Clostridium oryzae]